MTQPPANWYPDPANGAQLRYWDGTQWTAHTAPAQQPAAQYQTAAQYQAAPQRKKMGGGAIAAIVIGITAGGLILIGILAAIAIPVFLNQQKKVADIDAQHALQEIATQVATLNIDYPDENPVLTSQGSTVFIEVGGASETVMLPEGVDFGGFTSEGSYDFCVWVKSTQTTVPAWQFDTLTGLTAGDC